MEEKCEHDYQYLRTVSRQKRRNSRGEPLDWEDHYFCRKCLDYRMVERSRPETEWIVQEAVHTE